jgi:uncharacterized protein (DUF433 family)
MMIVDFIGILWRAKNICGVYLPSPISIICARIDRVSRCGVGRFQRIGILTYHAIITIEPGKRGGRPTIRGMRIAVADVLGWLAAGMTHAQIVADYPELTEDHIRACLAYAADRERRAVTAAE